MALMAPARAAQENAQWARWYEQHPAELTRNQHRQVVDHVTALMGLEAYLEWLHAQPAGCADVEVLLMDLYMVEFRCGAW